MTRKKKTVKESKPLSVQNDHTTHFFFEGQGKDCGCLGAIKLKIEQEIDMMKGFFRKKEQTLLDPLLKQ